MLLRRSGWVAASYGHLGFCGASAPITADKGPEVWAASLEYVAARESGDRFQKTIASQWLCRLTAGWRRRWGPVGSHA